MNDGEKKQAAVRMLKHAATLQSLDYTEKDYPDVELVPLICAKFHHHAEPDRWIEISFAEGESRWRSLALSSHSIDKKYDRRKIIAQLRRQIKTLENQE